jgi:hypothetical protein
MAVHVPPSVEALQMEAQNPDAVRRNASTVTRRGAGSVPMTRDRNNGKGEGLVFSDNTGEVRRASTR